jgi:hypothetical protein
MYWGKTLEGMQRTTPVDAYLREIEDLEKTGGAAGQAGRGFERRRSSASDAAEARTRLLI